MKPELSKIVKAEAEANYSEWAEQLLQEIYYAPEEHRAQVIKEQLLNAVKRGYIDGATQKETKKQKLDGEYKKAAESLDNCQCYKNYNASCWKCDSNY